MTGFAFGGSCLPKDVRALSCAARMCDLELLLVYFLLPNNERVIQHAFAQVSGRKVRRIGMIGLSFKSDTDDLRESPLVKLAEHLLCKGYQLKIYDPNVSLAQVTGSNKEYTEKRIPHLSSLIISSVAEFSECQLMLIGHRYTNAEQFLKDTEIPSIYL